MFTIYFIAMASNSSPTEDNTSGTDLSNIHSDDNLPNIPEDNFLQERD